MRARLKTEEGQKIYSKRKTTVEPDFGIIKREMGFRQFLMRGLENIGIEWDLVTISYNISRMYALKKPFACKNVGKIKNPPDIQ